MHNQITYILINQTTGTADVVHHVGSYGDLKEGMAAYFKEIGNDQDDAAKIVANFKIEQDKATWHEKHNGMLHLFIHDHFNQRRVERLHPDVQVALRQHNLNHYDVTVNEEQRKLMQQALELLQQQQPDNEEVKFLLQACKDLPKDNLDATAWMRPRHGWAL